MRRILGVGGGVTVLLVILSLGATAANAAFDPVYEVKNFSKTTERFLHLTGLPDYELQLAAQGVVNELDTVQILAGDPPPLGRTFLGNLCAHLQNACAGDIRLDAWASSGKGVVKPVLFTARNGSTLSGHIWATKAGPLKRPGVVITNGSVQAPEDAYWFAAETLAKAGYVVMTWDPQGQGYSDTIGEGADLLDGVPSQTGEPFYDGTEDALDFFFSDAAHPYVPRRSCSTGTSHAAKQATRVAAGLSSGYNPMAAVLDPAHVGLVGHSLGAGAVSYIGQLDPRVKAIVAYDNLSAGGAAPASCTSGSSPRPSAPITKPALGLSADYGLLPEPNLSEPDPLSKSAGSRALSAAHVDTGELIIRGGTHYEFSFIPNPVFGGTLRGADMVTWYTTAWMDKYLKGDPSADARLKTDRWRNDAQEAAVDPDHDGNMFSRYYRSRLDITPAGGGPRFTCEDLRTTCPLTSDGLGGTYSYLSAANAPDSNGPAASLLGGQSSQRAAGALGVPPAAAGSGGPKPGLININITIPGLLGLHIGL